MNPDINLYLIWAGTFLCLCIIGVGTGSLISLWLLPPTTNLQTIIRRAQIHWIVTSILILLVALGGPIWLYCIYAILVSASITIRFHTWWNNRQLKNQQG